MPTDILDEPEPTLCEAIRAKINDTLVPIGDTLLKNTIFSNVMVFTTIYALFGEDLKLAAFDYSADEGFIWCTSISFFLFMIEFIVQCYVKPEYRWGFYFTLDLASTLSLITDIPWMSPDFMSGGQGSSAAGTMKTSRAGAKAGRVVRIVRLVRMVRVVKLFKWKNDRGAKDEEEEEEGNFTAQPSKVSKRLTELTVQHIIVILLLMIIVFPFLDNPKALLGAEALDDQQLNGFETLDKMMNEWNGENCNNRCLDGAYDESCRGCMTQEELLPVLKNYASTEDLIFVYIQNVNESLMTAAGFKADVVDYDAMGKKLDFFRESEVACTGDGCNELNCLTITSDPRLSCAFYDIEDAARIEAWLSFAKTTFVMLVLTWAIYVFSQDALTLVVEPIERMMTLVQKLAENPLGDLKKKGEDDEKADVAEGGHDETFLLEQTLGKISGLLQVGFGVAGSEVISKNMSTENDGEFNYMVAGKKITSVFGFAIIEDFTNTCSCLEEETCTYINTIANIVHMGAHNFHGAPNKNIGCAFLMVWKICDGVLPGMRDLRDDKPAPITNEFLEWRARQRQSIGWMSKGAGTESRLVPPMEMVESAVTSFLKVEVDMHHANNGGKLERFNKNPAMVEEFGNHFKVHMGLGLHIGWAIEGTIGSRYKIDASYLSPNVNVAARLEAATHIFGCPLLLSGFLVDELSAPAKLYHRMVDVVSVKGSSVPLQIWTFDITNFPETILVPRFDASGCQIPISFEHDKDYNMLQEGLDPLFTNFFNDAVQHYVGGNWKEAQDKLKKALQINPQDGPSKTLMSTLAGNKFVAPAGWEGFRALTSKT